MSFEKKLLFELYRRYNNGEQEAVSEIALQESLGFSYKLIHISAEDLIQKKYVKTFTTRGGQTAYLLTSEGLFYSELLIRKHKKRRFILIVGGCCIIFILTLFFLFLI